ncbi:ATP-binding protein [Uliginosibacterium flavum]|uniref:histidine kinase n=1 Tax=Uliginosibacterium flavum TaxID=1396831 RepID=A0ABV2THP0_9RHOO
MHPIFLRFRWWLLVWCVLSLAGSLLIGHARLNSLREAFETDSRIVHRVLSQRVLQHEAILATLSLLQTAQGAEHEQRLPAVYSQILTVRRRTAGEVWPNARLAAAEAASRLSKRPELVEQDFDVGRYTLVLAGLPASHAISIGLREMLPWAEWPVDPQGSPMRVELQYAGQGFVIQPGRLQTGGWQFDFEKHLAAVSQPFDVITGRSVGWGELPWLGILGWTLLVSLAQIVGYHVQQQQVAHKRAEELLRMGQVARLNSLGELAAGMAHELNQPLTAVLANTQAAKRLLAEEPPELDTVREAMAQAVQQARRASEVVSRLRRVVERPGSADLLTTVDLVASLRGVLDLLEPECRRRGVRLNIDADAVCLAQAEPVALEQILHNLLMNALQALGNVPAAQRTLHIHIGTVNGLATLSLADSGPGIAPDILPHIFEPFFSTRTDGLGLGLSLCESLVLGMGGSLHAGHNNPQGAIFTLSLPVGVPA